MSNKTQQILSWLDAEKEAVKVIQLLQTNPEAAFKLREKDREHEYRN